MDAPDIREEVQRLFDEALKLQREQRGTFLEKNASSADIVRHVNRLLAEIAESPDTSTSIASDASCTAQPTYIGQLKSGEVLASRFKVARFIAAGGMGEVYEAEDLELLERVAIKCIRQDVLEQSNALSRFRSEVHLARRVTHANVCRIYDLFRHIRETDGRKEEIAFVSMEFLAGETLSSRLLRKGRLSRPEVHTIIVQIAAGLSAAHQAGIVHRDFKPGNVILVPGAGNSSEERVVITDFGLALHSAGESTRTAEATASHAFVGTPAYMAPEQIEGRPATPATDIYALGLVIYEMLAGEGLFENRAVIARKPGSGSSSAPSLKQLVPDISDCWDRTIAKCLQRDPAARFSSATEVAKELSDQRASSFSRAVRFRRAAGFALGLTLLFGFAAAYYFRGLLFKGRSTTVHAATRPTVAVLGFKNLSKKSDVDWVSPALSEMLGTELTAGEQLRIIPSEQIAHAKTDLSLTDEDGLGRDTLKRVRQNLGSDFVLLGSFLDIGGQVRFDVTLQNAAAGETIANISESAPEQNLPGLAARVGARVRQKLGIADVSPGDAAHARASQSSSLEATRLYSQALEKLHAFDSPSARDLLERAIAEDPNYALAHAALAECWRSLGYGDKSTAEAKKAMDLSANLSREDRLAIEAQYRNSIRDFGRESEIYKTLFNFYPDNLEYGFALAKSQFYGGKLAEANSTLDALQKLPSPQGDDPRIDYVRAVVAERIGDNKKALALAERVELRAQQRGAKRLVGEALGTKCSCLSRLGQPSEASAACDKARVIFAEVGDHLMEANVLGQIAFQAQNHETARAANTQQIALLKKTGSDGGLAWGMTVAGELAADSGDYQEAALHYNAALDLYKKVNDPSGIISGYGNLAWVNSLQGNLSAAAKEDEAAIALTRQTNSKYDLDAWLVDLADVLLDQGNIAEARRRLEEGLEVNHDTGAKTQTLFLHTSMARLFYLQGKFDESRREAELAVKLSRELNDEHGAEERRLLLARLDIAEGRPESASVDLRKSLSYFTSKNDKVFEIRARTMLIEALLATPSDASKRELAELSGITPASQDVDSRLAADIQIGRARYALADTAGALKLLADVESEAQKRGYQPYWLESRLARAEIGLRSADPSAARKDLQQIQQEAQAKGLILIGQKAARSAKPN